MFASSPIGSKVIVVVALIAMEMEPWKRMRMIHAILFGALIVGEWLVRGNMRQVKDSGRIRM